MLLKNDGVLPLSKTLKTIAVVGPNADEMMSLLGNYYGTPSQPVTCWRASARRSDRARCVRYARGVDLVEGRRIRGRLPPIDSAYLRPSAGSAEHGLKGEYFRGRELQGSPVFSRVDPTVDFRWDRGSPTSDLVARGEVTADHALDNDDFSARWTGQLLPPASGTYTVIVAGDDGFRLFVDGKPVIDDWTTTSRAQAKTAAVTLEAGQACGRPARVLRGQARRRDTARVAAARREAAVRRSARRRARGRRGDLRRRPDRRRRRRGDEGVVSRLCRRRSHRHRAAGAAGAAARGARTQRASRSCSC